MTRPPAAPCPQPPDGLERPSSDRFNRSLATASTTVAVIGAVGKMGRRVSSNLVSSDFTTLFAENSPGGQELIRELGRELTVGAEAAARADVVILAVPDVVLARAHGARTTNDVRAGRPPRTVFRMGSL